MQENEAVPPPETPPRHPHPRDTAVLSKGRLPFLSQGCFSRLSCTLAAWASSGLECMRARKSWGYLITPYTQHLPLACVPGPQLGVTLDLAQSPGTRAASSFLGRELLITLSTDPITILLKILWAETRDLGRVRRGRQSWA